MLYPLSLSLKYLRPPFFSIRCPSSPFISVFHPSPSLSVHRPSALLLLSPAASSPPRHFLTTSELSLPNRAGGRGPPDPNSLGSLDPAASDLTIVDHIAHAQRLEGDDGDNGGGGLTEMCNDGSGNQQRRQRFQ